MTSNANLKKIIKILLLSYFILIIIFVIPQFILYMVNHPNSFNFEKKLNYKLKLIDKIFQEKNEITQEFFFNKIAEVIFSDQYQIYFVHFIENGNSLITKNNYEIYVLSRNTKIKFNPITFTPIIPKEKIYKMKVGESVKEIKQLPEKILFPNFYSSTENVLRRYDDFNVTEGTAMYSWVKQEKFKGMWNFRIAGFSSPFCGYSVNNDYSEH